MSDQDLGGDDLKLVRYKVLFVKPGYEHAFLEEEELVHENTNNAAFTALKIAEFIQRLQKGKTPVPDKWKDQYPPDKSDPESPEKNRCINPYISNGFLTGFPEDDKKYLRLYYEVLDRYPREPLRREGRQIELLKQIRDRI